MILLEREFKDKETPRLYWALTLEQVTSGIYSEIGTFKIIASLVRRRANTIHVGRRSKPTMGAQAVRPGDA